MHESLDALLDICLSSQRNKSTNEVEKEQATYYSYLRPLSYSTVLCCTQAHVPKNSDLKKAVTSRYVHSSP